MVILGVDPGTLKTGYGVVRYSGSGVQVVACDCIVNKSTVPMPNRLKSIFDALTDVMKVHRPDMVAIETAFYGKNAQSALKLGHARGVIILTAVEQNIPTYEYSPREIKQALVGNGNASKQQVQYMIKSLLHLTDIPKGYDTTDALAVAICHLQRSIQLPRRYTSWKSFLSVHPEKVSTTRTMRKS